MKRILIVGSCGAGKSTLAVQLSQITKLPLIHLDSVFWLPNWVQKDKDIFDEELRGLLSNEEWIIDGNYHRTMEMRFEKADTIIFLDYNRYLCIFRAIKRATFKKRADEIKGCNEGICIEFLELLKWAWNYPKNRKPIVDGLLKNLPKAKKVHIFKKPKHTARFVEEMKKMYSTAI